jgi:hypothetical protein
MRVRAIHHRADGAPPAVRAVVPPLADLPITSEREYDVYALSVFGGVVYLQIISDYQIVQWLPSWFFRVDDQLVPSDWICSVFDDEPSMVLGPEFVAGSIEAYSRMVELEPESEARFWEQVPAVSRTRQKERE